MKKYKVVRTYDNGEKTDGIEDLQNAFDEGYELVQSSEYVPERIRNSVVYFGYIEYILAKEQSEPEVER